MTALQGHPNDDRLPRASAARDVANADPARLRTRGGHVPLVRRKARVHSPRATLPASFWKTWTLLAGVISSALLAIPFGLVYFPRATMLPDSATSVILAQGSVLLVLSIVLVLAWFYAVWRARLEFLAWAPGPITMLSFQDRTHDQSAPERAREFASLFENHLVQTKIYGSTAIPSTGRPSDFLRIVESAGDRLSGAWGAASRLVRLLAPLSAYQVSCSMQGIESDGSCVLLVELSRLPSTSLAPFVIRSHSWEEAVRRAASDVAAEILPRTRQCDNPPWRTWRGSRIQPDLFDAYQEFLSLRQVRHFDDAMASLRGAIRLDPGNLALRLDLGKLQERMQMYLDALLTYDDIVSIAARRNRRLARWWGSSTTDSRLQQWSDARRTRGLRPDDPVILVARYRHAMLLGLSEKLAQQWWSRKERCGSGLHRSVREERRAYLRTALAHRLDSRYRSVLDSDLFHGGGNDRLRCLSDLRVADGENRRRELIAEARIFFATASQFEFDNLARDYAPRRLRDLMWCVVRARRLPLRHLPASRRPGALLRRVLDRGRRVRVPATRSWRERQEQTRILPREAILMGLPWSCLRRAMALAWAQRAGLVGPEGSRPDVRHAAFAIGGGGGRRHRPAFRGAEVLLEDGWPPSPGDLRRVVQRLTGRPESGLRTWRAHFNAACTLSLPLLPDGPEIPVEAPPPRAVTQRDAEKRFAENENVLARAAVVELERALARAGSGYAAQQRDWLLSEEPDLDHLRGRPEFKNFEATTFGSIGHAVERGPDVHMWEQSTYVARFISASALEMADLWRRRESTLELTVAGLMTWLDEEMAGWRLAEQLGMDGRDSRTRQDVVRDIRRTGRLAGTRLSVAHPRFSDRILDRQLASMEGQGQTSLLAVERLAHDAMVKESVGARTRQAIRRADHRLDRLRTSMRVEGSAHRSPCCSLAQPSIFETEEHALRESVLQWVADAPSPATARYVQRWARVSADRWAALAAWFDDVSLGHGSLDLREARFRASLARAASRLELPPGT